MTYNLKLRDREDFDGKPVTLPAYVLPEFDVEAEAREAAARIAERRLIRNGLDAWQAIGKAQSFDAWKRIGAALAIGRDFALRSTGANSPAGQIYSRAFSGWIKQHGFDRMPKSVRSVAIELVENLPAIEAWRATLPERQRKRLVHPLSNVQRWKASTQSNGRCPRDLRRDANAAWQRFVAAVGALPHDQAMPLWQAVQAQAAAAMEGASCP